MSLSCVLCVRGGVCTPTPIQAYIVGGRVVWLQAGLSGSMLTWDSDSVVARHSRE